MDCKDHSEIEPPWMCDCTRTKLERIESNLAEAIKQANAFERGMKLAEAELARVQAENAAMREALTKLRDCDWVITLPDRMDAVREIAAAALEKVAQ